MRPTRSRFSLTVIHNARSLFDRAGIDTAEGQRTDEGVVHDLESEHGKRLGIISMTLDIGFGLDVDTP